MAKKIYISEEDSQLIKQLVMSGNFTLQDIINHFDNKFTINQLKYHINKYYREEKKELKTEYSRGSSKLGFILRELFQADKVHEEYHIGKRMRLDFYVESPYNLAFEFDGSQHETFVPFFFEGRCDFNKAQERDRYKEEYCKDRGINLFRFNNVESLTPQMVKEAILKTGYGSGLISSDKTLTFKERQEARKVEQQKRLKKIAKQKRDENTSKIKTFQDVVKQHIRDRSKPLKNPQTEYKEKLKELARKHREAQYERKKEWQKKLKEKMKKDNNSNSEISFSE
jgi:hypothetical protein